MGSFRKTSIPFGRSREEESRKSESNDVVTEDVIKEEDKVALKKQMSLFVCITIIVGNTIGTGIFISPKGVLLYSGSVGLSLVVWTLAGLLSLLGALSFAELGTTFGKSGGDYTYTREAFGPLLAFLVVWKYFVLYEPGSKVVLSLSFARYVVQPFFLGCDPPDAAIAMIAIASLVVAYFVNSWKVDAATSVQNIFTVAKVTGLSIIVIAGMVQLANGKTEYLKDAFSTKPESFMNVSLAFYQAIFACGGWENLNMLTEELRNPARDFPIAVVVSETIVIILYVMANISYFTAMSPEELLATDAVGVTFADYLFGSFSWIIPAFIAISVFGTINGTALTRSRIFFTCARDGYLPATIGMVHVNFRTPLASLMVGALLVAITFVISSVTGTGITNLLNYITFAHWLFFALANVGLVYLRWKRPDLDRPFKVPLVVPILFSLAVFYLSITAIIAAPVDTGIGVAIILTGIPVYLFGQWKNKPSYFYRVTDGVGNFVQKFLLVVSQEKETY
ncbi:cystine/glutamate transporter-like [Ptychodera flava]|uniref:cystine/glutamate transporter-like n=1 Tax=Ptychodera flava TaxID=63121 RepID=UPI00396A9541